MVGFEPAVFQLAVECFILINHSAISQSTHYGICGFLALPLHPYCKQSNTEVVEGLGTRLFYTV